MHINPISQSNQFEFNDSVLETKAWRSSRYDGRQLSGSAINVARVGDVSYGRTPVIRNNTRTFYLANEIISLNNTGSAYFEDPTLQYIPGFSYILLGRAITVNSDNTIKIQNIEALGGIEDNTSIGFRREYQKNIPIGSKIALVTTDEAITNRSFNSYNVYYNKGRLQPLFTFVNGTDITVHFTNMIGMSGGSNDTIPAKGGQGSFSMAPNFPNDETSHFKFFHLSQKPGSISNLFKGTVLESVQNRKLLQTFFTGSLSNPDPYGSWSTLPNVDLVDDDLYIDLMESIHTELSSTKNIFTVTCLASRFYGRTGSDLGANVDYVVFDPNSAGVGVNPGGGIVTNDQYLYETPPIITNNTQSGFFLTEDISFLSTNEINGIDATVEYGVTMSLSNKYPAQQKYQTPISASDSGTRISFMKKEPATTLLPLTFRGDYTISFLNQDKPALLLQLTKETEFPEGRGSNPLIVLPETLHPYIKDNLIHFMAKAGLDIGDRKVVPALDETNRTLP